MVRLEGVTRGYGAHTVLQQFEGTLPEGSITAFLGPNGSGKSTTLKVLAGLLQPEAGRARLNDSDCLVQRHRIGYLPETNPLVGVLTVRESLRDVCAFHNLPRSRAWDTAQLCRLKKEWNLPVGTLSKGTRQRVGLACALVHEPSLLILDEPTAGLDLHQQDHFRSVLKKVREGTTILLSTHHLEDACALADHLWVMGEGRLRLQGTCEAICPGWKDEDLEGRVRLLRQKIMMEKGA